MPSLYAVYLVSTQIDVPEPFVDEVLKSYQSVPS